MTEPGVASSLTKRKHQLERSEVSLPTNVLSTQIVFVCVEETGHSDHSFMKTCLSDDIKYKAEIHALVAGGDLLLRYATIDTATRDLIGIMTDLLHRNCHLKMTWKQQLMKKSIKQPERRSLMIETFLVFTILRK